METWRILATGLMAVPGLIGVLLVMAKARERTGRASSVAVTGLVGVTALLVAGVLTLVALPPVAAWVLAGSVTVIVSVLAMAS
ncbi:hypothetical protein B1813_12245 [Saccharomonospora piscinae]|uniref:Uncharacterized protein n=1 Tax=Saccharomonospora piscinae TaxID=687388 RepID=A0A1V9A717_SACPI|nr:hypothetical protein [Saccharomonospora piscinae]OQO92891.1 hypothetical protein B1813_12245 [Saccharomonospora piscinae]TLW93026.1 hypothetical protein FFT09_06195 [Saccharomonospora piscinae]